MQDRDAEKDEPREQEPDFEPPYHRGPVIMRGKMIPKESTNSHLLAPDKDTSWLHTDPWRVLRIQAEFVDGFGALAELGPAVSMFAPARARTARTTRLRARAPRRSPGTASP